jgi:hypothetical protein
MKIAAGNKVRHMTATNDARAQAAKGQVVGGQRRVWVSGRFCAGYMRP